jgi:hypothetical protein
VDPEGVLALGFELDPSCGVEVDPSRHPGEEAATRRVPEVPVVQAGADEGGRGEQFVDELRWAVHVVDAGAPQHGVRVSDVGLGRTANIALVGRTVGRPLVRRWAICLGRGWGPEQGVGGRCGRVTLWFGDGRFA